MVESGIAFNFKLVFILLLLAGVVFVVVTAAIALTRRRRPEARGFHGGSALGVLAILGVLAVLGFVAASYIVVREERRGTEYERRDETRQEIAREHARAMGVSQVASNASSEEGTPQPVARSSAPRPGALVVEAGPGGAPISGSNLPSEVQIPLPTRDDLQAWKETGVLAKQEGEKSWVADAAGSLPFEGMVLGWALRGRLPGPSGEIVGYSGLELSQESARDAAARSAASQVKVLLLRDVADSVRDEIPAAYVRKALDRFDLDVLRYVNDSAADSFAQEVELSRVPERVYRAALLVKVDAAAFGPFLKRFQKAIADSVESGRLERRQIIVTVASALGLALVVFLLYAFVNAGTKGHFAWPLRIISFGTLIALYLALMYIQGWFPR